MSEVSKSEWSSIIVTSRKISRSDGWKNEQGSGINITNKVTLIWHSICNTQDNVYLLSICNHDKVNAELHALDLINVKVVANSHTKPTDFNCKSACKLHSPTLNYCQLLAIWSESWHSFYHATESKKLKWFQHCNEKFRSKLFSFVY